MLNIFGTRQGNEKCLKTFNRQKLTEDT